MEAVISPPIRKKGPETTDSVPARRVLRWIGASLQSQHNVTRAVFAIATKVVFEIEFVGMDTPNWRVPPRGFVSRAIRKRASDMQFVTSLYYDVEPSRPIILRWNVDRSENILWSTKLGSQTHGSPTIAAGKVFIETNNGQGYVKRYPKNVELGYLVWFALIKRLVSFLGCIAARS